MRQKFFGNAQVLYDDKKDILYVKNLSTRKRCIKQEDALHNITKFYDIEQKPCMFQIGEASYLFKNDVDFLRDFSYSDLNAKWT